MNYYRVGDYIFSADAEQPWTAARRRRVPDDVSHTTFYGVFRIISLMDYRHGLPLFLSRGLLMDTGSRGLLSTDYELTGYHLHRYHLYRMLLFPDDLHKLFNSVLLCLTVYYHRLTAISLLLPSPI